MPHETVNPAVQGQWLGATRTPGDSAVLGDDQAVFPVHTILLKTGRVLMFSGGWESTNLLHRSWTFDPASWDPTDPGTGVIGRWFLPEFDDDPIANPPPPTGAHDPDIDLFCAHHVQIEDGRILVVGGDGISEHNNDSIHFYDPDIERWSRIPEEMVEGRWYPTATHLPDGSVVAFTGDPTVAPTELMSPPGYVPKEITGGRRLTGGVENAQSSFPGMFLVPGGRIFYIPVTFRYLPPPGMSVDDHIGNTVSFRITDALSDPPVGVWEDHGIVPTIRRRREGTSVLLSPAQAGRIAMIGGIDGGTTHDTIEILDTQGTPAWSPGGTMHHSRTNVNAVLLPDGKVLILGGTGGDKWEDNMALDERRFTSEIWDPSIPYDPTDASAAFTETGEMHRGRCYHSCGILLRDGRVLVAGGDDRLEQTADGLGPAMGERVGGSSQRTMEIYEPPYMHNGAQPVLDAVVDTGVGDDEIRYSGRFTVETTATNIAMIALMRPGAPTHHTDTEQRHIPLVFWQVPGGYRAQVVGDPAVAPPGYYMVWIVDDQGRPCQQAKFVRLSHRGCQLITDRSQFSIHDVQAAEMAGVSEFENCFFVAIDGYRPEQLGITDVSPDPTQLNAWAPAITFEDAGGGGVVADIDRTVNDMHLEVNDLTVPQRVTFEYGVRFTGTDMFPAAGVGDERRPITLTSTVEGHICIGTIDLFLQPNPFMLDGQTHWLSDDLRVFQIKPGGSQSGIAFPAAGTPEAYLSTFLSQCDTMADSAGHPFRLLPTNQAAATLELSSEVDGDPVFNFAVARVHYQSVGTPADDVRVFFRAFTTSATSMEYRPETYPIDGGANLPQVGQNATDILTIPFFSVDRGALGGGDTENVKTLPASGAGSETLRYFGAWLDINQTDPVITDPADGVVKSVQNLIRGKHQCLVAEINFGPDPIPVGATPANNENLSQRNLAIVESDNPGPRDAHTVTHTFQLKTTYPGERGQILTHRHAETIERKLADFSTAEFDELIVLWGGLPEDTEATIFMPTVPADDILRAASYRYGAPKIVKIDAHTIRCRVGDISYVPLPLAQPTQIAGLITLVLPPDVKTGEEYRVVVRQHSQVQGRITGLFDITIPVMNAEDILPGETRFLSVLKSIAAGVHPNSVWFPVFNRYLKTVSTRVGGFGGDPDSVEPSPAGTGGRDDPAGPGFPGSDLFKECCRSIARRIDRMGMALIVIAILLFLMTLILLIGR